MKVFATLGKILAALVLVGVLVVVIIFFLFMNKLSGYKEPGPGIQSHPVFQDKTFEKYRVTLREANKQYFESNDIYYYFAKEVKNEITDRCVERYLKEHNITDADGWRFSHNVYLEYIRDNNISSDTSNDKFVKSERKSERLGYEHPQWFHDYKYNEKIDCNLTLEESFESYVKGYRKFYGAGYREYNNGWVDYLFFNYK
ncbi:MAG TPA: hypothetical protein VIM88_00970 [Sulfurovum sp.]|uniref:hypothetical protein n=1 Tax=Sulfurovum sp. TaxID=1969726 RepID=UPI002F9467A2